MLYEQQPQQQQQRMRMDVKRRLQERKRAPVEEERLQVVDLSGMSLENLPNPPLNIGTICKLDLSNNNLQGVGKDKRVLLGRRNIAVEFFDFSKSVSIPESATARMLNLIVLDVHSNQLKSLPNSIGCLSKLKVLNVSGNLLESLPKTIEDCRSLDDLNANFNKLTKLPDTIGFELVNLKKLSVNSNKLVFLPHSITHLTNLQVLDARLNCLRSLPEDLENLINLQVLNISQNFQYLTSLPYSLGLLMSLVELDVSYNRIKALPDSLGCLRKLQKLSVEGNPLVSPPVEVFDHGINAVKEYLSEKMSSGGHKDYSAHNNKKRGWFGKLKKFSTFNGRRDQEIKSSSEGLFKLPKYHPIEGFATPRYVGGNNVGSSPKYMGMFSPLRLFSPKSYCTR